MSEAITRHRVSRGVLWGAFGVLAWATLTAFTGTSTAQAADDGSAPEGPLSSLISEVTSTVSDTVVKPVVEEVAKPVVTEVVKPVVESVVAEAVKPAATQAVEPVTAAAPRAVEDVTKAAADVPVVGDIATPALSAVAKTTTSVTASLGETLQSAPVGSVVTPVLEIVTALPIVGDVVVDSGLGGAVDDVIDVIDTTTAVGGDVVSVVPDVVESLDPLPAVSVVPTTNPSGVSVAAHPTRIERADVGPGPLTAKAFGPHPDAFSPPSDSWLRSASPPDVGAAERATQESILSRALGVPFSGAPAPTSSAAHGSSATGELARLSDSAFAQMSVWSGAGGTCADILPASPVADTDVSPD